MTTDLTHHNPTQGGPAPAGGRRAVATDRLSWNATIERWEGLTEHTRTTAGAGTTLLGTGAERFTTIALRVNNQPHQLRIGWRAWLDRIVIAREIRPLTKGADGKQRPDGPWRTHLLTNYPVTGTPTRTHGTVPTDITNGTPHGAGHSDSRPVPAEQASAAAALPTLPGAVQSTIVRAVPTPTEWLGAATQSTRGDRPHRQQVMMLRMDARHAVVITADRRLPDGANLTVDQAARALSVAPWDVTQYILPLDGARELTGTAPERQIGSR